MVTETYKALIVAVIEDRVKNGDNWPDMREVARAFAVAPRTLQRRLRAEGTTFRNVLNDLRLQLVTKHSATRATQAELSVMLGYSEASAFRRASKRWIRSTRRNG